MIIFHHTLKHERALMVPREISAWLAARAHAYPDVTFQLGRIVHTPDERRKNKATVERYAQSFVGGATPGIAQTSFLYLDETWSIRVIGDLTAEERAEIAGLPPASHTVRGDGNVIFRKRSPEQPATARAAEYVPVRQDRF